MNIQCEQCKGTGRVNKFGCKSCNSTGISEIDPSELIRQNRIRLSRNLPKLVRVP